MLSSIFNPSKPKSFLDVLVLAVLAVQIGLFVLLPSSIRRPTSLALFLFWRTAYDLGLGYLLHEQSARRGLVAWAKDYKIFDPNHNPGRYAFIRRQLSDKMGDDYNFEKSPIEYNTWLLFKIGRSDSCQRFCELRSFCNCMDPCSVRTWLARAHIEMVSRLGFGFL